MRTFDLASVYSIAVAPGNKRALLNGELWDLETGDKVVTIIGSRGKQWLTISKARWQEALAADLLPAWSSPQRMRRRWRS